MSELVRFRIYFRKSQKDLLMYWMLGGREVNHGLKRKPAVRESNELFNNIEEIPG